MSQEAISVWNWIIAMNIKSGELVDLRAFNVWCGTEHLAVAYDFIPIMDELVMLGNLVDKNKPETEWRWDYWVA